MAEPDAAGMGGALGGGDDAASAVFRGRTKVEIDYKDVTGLTKQMNSLADAIKRVKSGLESLNSSKAQKALKDLQGATGGGSGGGFGGGTQNGGPTSFSSSGSQGQDGKGDTGRGFGGLSKTQYAVGGTIAAIGALSNAYQGRKAGDLMSDVTAMRTVYTSDSPSFGLKQATSYNAAQFGPYSINREDALQGAGMIAGRYGGQGSASAMRAASGTGAYAMGSFQGSAFGAEMYNQLNAPQVINAQRMFGGTTSAQMQPVETATSMARLAFGSERPTNAQLNNFRPGMNQYNNMLQLTGGNAGLANMQVELMRARQRYETMGSPRGQWSEDTLKSIGQDKGLQKKLFGEDSYYLSQQKIESGKALNAEELMNMSRKGLVSSNEAIAQLNMTMHEVLKEIQKYSGPLGNFLGSIGGGGAGGLLGGGLDILQTAALLGGGKAAGGGILGGIKAAFGMGGGAAAAEGGAAAGGAAGGAAAIPAAAVMAGTALTAANSDRFGSNLPGRKYWGPVLRTMQPLNIFDTPGYVKSIGKGISNLGGLIGDPIDSSGRGGVGDPVGATNTSGGMSVSQAEEILRSRGGHTSGIPALATDFKVKLGMLFQKNPKLFLKSGARNRAEQERLYKRWINKVPGQAPAAKPGTSNHEFGLAADIGPDSEYGWLAKNAPGAGLVKPMDYEPWHWEPPGAKARRGGAGPMEEIQSDSGQGVGGGGMIGAMVRSVLGIGGSGMGAPGRPDALSGTAISSAGATGTQVGAAGGGGIFQGGPGAITINEAANAARAAGIPSDQIPMAIAIAMAESSLNPNAHNPNPPDDSYGLWQINMLGKMGPDRRSKLGLKNNSELFSPGVNARAMAMISGGGHNWQPWSTYGNGAYKAHLGQVNQALTTGVGDPVGAGGGGASPSSVPAMVSVGASRGGTQVHAPIYITMKEASDAEIYRVAVAVKNTIDGVLNDVDTARTGG